jgi:hypothetical protein
LYPNCADTPCPNNEGMVKGIRLDMFRVVIGNGMSLIGLVSGNAMFRTGVSREFAMAWVHCKKKVSDFPKQDVTNQTLGTGKIASLFYSVVVETLSPWMRRMNAQSPEDMLLQVCLLSTFFTSYV